MLQQINKIVSRWSPALLIMAAIFFASSTPSTNLPSFGLMDTLIKKCGHLAGYFLLTLTYLRGINTHPKKAAMIALGLIVIWAASDEFHQSFVVGRHPSLVDVVIDMIGACVAVWAVQIHASLRRLIRFGL
jgi:VanZ family protein